MWLAHGTGFGRAVYVIGGNERSAQLLGRPVARTRIAIGGLLGLFCVLQRRMEGAHRRRSERG